MKTEQKGKLLCLALSAQCGDAVTEPVMRLYDSILNKRLLRYTVSGSLCAITQQGFLSHLSTLQLLLIPQHILDLCKANSRAVNCCFLDLKAAYHRVERPLLRLVLLR